MRERSSLSLGSDRGEKGPQTSKKRLPKRQRNQDKSLLVLRMRPRTTACTKSPCDEARAPRNGGEQATNPQGWFRRRWGFCVSRDPGARNQSASRPSLGRRREEHKGN